MKVRAETATNDRGDENKNRLQNNCERASTDKERLKICCSECVHTLRSLEDCGSFVHIPITQPG